MPLPPVYLRREESCTREDPAGAAHQVGQPRSEIMPTSTEPTNQLALPRLHDYWAPTTSPGTAT